MAKKGHIPWNKGKGGRKKNKGYIVVLTEESQFNSMKDKRGYIPEHRLIMARQLGRALNDDEVVHHVNGDKTDNRIENLQLLENQSKHRSNHRKFKNKKEYRKYWRGKHKEELNRLNREYYWKNREKILEQKKFKINKENCYG